MTMLSVQWTRLEKHGHALGERPKGDQFLHRQRAFAELADGDRRAVERQRRNDDVDARTVGQPRVAERARLVHPASQRRENLVDDPAAAFHVKEFDRGKTQPPLLLGINRLVPVHHDFGDGVVLEQLFEGAVADHFIDDVAEQLDAKLPSDGNLVRGEPLVDEFLDALFKRAFAAAFQKFGIQRLDQVGQELLLELHDKFLGRVRLGRGGPLRAQRRGWRGVQRGGGCAHAGQRLRGGLPNAGTRRNARGAGRPRGNSAGPRNGSGDGRNRTIKIGRR